jgi:Na+/serine symporter
LQIKASESSGIAIILIGITLSSITFVVACVHLYGGINVLPVLGVTASFGEAWSPLVEAVIRILYLGLMGLIASRITEKGLTALLQNKLIDKTISEKRNPID